MAAPSVGRTVHYTSYGTPGGEYQSECRAAIIAGVPDPRSLAVSRLVEDEVAARQVVELCVLNPRGVFFDMCEHDEDEKRGGTWHWPEVVASITDAEAERLIDHLTAKHENAPHDPDTRSIVGTTVADTLLVVEGSLSVDDYAPRETV